MPGPVDATSSILEVDQDDSVYNNQNCVHKLKLLIQSNVKETVIGKQNSVLEK